MSSGRKKDKGAMANKYEVQIVAIVTPANVAVINTIRAYIEGLDNDKIALEDYRKNTLTVEGENKMFSASIRFHSSLSRDAIKNWLFNKAQEAGVASKLLVGSYIGGHICINEDDKTGCPPLTIFWEKVA